MLLNFNQLEDIMKNNVKSIDIFGLITGLLCVRKKILKWGIIGAIFGLIIAFSLPNEYTSTAIVVPENITPQKGGNLSGLAALAGVNMQEVIDGVSYKIYPEIMKLSPFILELANIEVNDNGTKMSFLHYVVDNTKKPWWSYIVKSPIYAVNWIMSLFTTSNEATDQSVIDLGQLTKEQIKFVNDVDSKLNAQYDTETGILTLNLTTQNPVISKQIVDSILVNLQDYMVKYKIGKSKQDFESTEKLLGETKSNFYRLDSIYADVSERNMNLRSPIAALKVQRALEQRSIAFSSYQQVAQKLEAISLKIQEDTPVITVLSPPSVAIKPVRPNKLMIIIGLMFTFSFAFSGFYVVKLFLISEENHK